MHLRERKGNGPGGQINLTPEQADKAIRESRQPGIAFLRTAREQRLRGDTSGCWFGGNPTLPTEFEWPTYAAADGVEMPMQFLLQVDLAAVPRTEELPQFPGTGTLFVFYDHIVAPFQFEHEHLNNGTACRIIYAETVSEGCSERSIPPIPDLDWFELPSYESRNPSSFTRWAFDPVLVDTYPVTGSGLADSCEDRLKEVIAERDAHIATQMPEGLFKRQMKVSSLHTMFGASQRRYHPDAETCNLIGRDYDPDLMLSDDHILLFSIAADTHIGHAGLHGCGVGFWITKTDLANSQFENVVVWTDHYS